MLPRKTRQDQVTHSRRMKSSSKQICAHAEEADTVSASSACGQAEGKKVLVQVLSGTAPRGTIRGRLFNRGLVPKWARFLLLVWLIFFPNMARKVVDFQGLLLGAFFVPVFGPGLLTCAARVPVFGPKIWTPSRGQKHNSDCNYCVRFFGDQSRWSSGAVP